MQQPALDSGLLHFLGTIKYQNTEKTRAGGVAI
jgi:hypothetical protein